MEQLAAYGVAATLKDGSPVWVRAIRPDDRDTLGAAFAALSERTVYHRFFQSKTSLTTTELTYLTELDFVDHVGLFVLAGGRESRVLMGVGRFIRLAEDRERADIAFTVADAYQGRGVGRLLLAHLIQLARVVGIRYLAADVLPGNEAMLRVFRGGGVRVDERVRSRVVEVVLDVGLEGDG